MVKPSRGTVSFFVLLAIAVAAKFGWRKYETTSFTQDGPPAHSTRRLLRCMLGSDVERLLVGRLPGRDITPWADRITERLRRLVARDYSAEWPARCVPIAERLSVRFSRDSRTGHAAHLLDELQQTLTAAARDRVVAIDSVERGLLGSQLAALALEVSVMSAGAEHGWDSYLPPSPSDLDAAPALLLDRPTPLPLDAQYAVFALPDMVLYQNARDGRLHRVTYDAHDVPNDLDIGRGAPIQSSNRNGATLIAADAGDQLFLPGGEPAELVSLPDAIARGSELVGEWQIALTPESLWLMSVDRGVIRVRTTPRSGEVHWSEPLAVIGERDAMVGGALLSDPAAPEHMAVIAVRRGARGFLIERYDIGGGNPITEAHVLATDAPAYDPRVVSCSAGGLRYLLVASAEGFTMNVTDGVFVHQRELTYAAGSGPTRRRVDVTCNTDFALVVAEIQGPRIEMLPWDREGAVEPESIQPPLPGDRARVVDAATVGSGDLVAIVDNGAVIRSYTTHFDPSRHGRLQWGGGELLAMQLPAGPERHDDDVRLYQMADMISEGTQIGVLETVREGPFRFVGRLGSRDSGDHWRGVR